MHLFPQPGEEGTIIVIQDALRVQKRIFVFHIDFLEEQFSLIAQGTDNPFYEVRW